MPTKRARARVDTKHETCSQAHLHTPAPTGYIQWHEWAEGKSKTHRQRKCPGCGLYRIWEPKESRT